ncbi:MULTISPECIES: response regulator [unclassified Pseudoalteromonas]|uniref:response regulator n=1 Tax=unclassified Pseudoalteromonas TaxID=194690 RepID=UPI00209795D0|nr:response regulator [Pseudoalteromonas sp. XMcav2-N]MCO7188942.1 response regulator [Pseudoalteromonas sp. XMcav2-N]
MPYSILLVDDDEVNHDIAMTMLGETHSYVSAFNGEDALALFSERKYDAVLLDVVMPGMNGYEVCQAIRNASSHNDTPVLFVSSKDCIDDKLEGFKAGGDDYITKPFDADELAFRIERLVKYSNEIDTLKVNCEAAEEVTMTAITSCSELGLCLEFIENTYRCNTLSELSTAILALCQNLNLKASVQLGLLGEFRDFSNFGVINPLERELLKKGRESKTVINIEKRSFFNSAYCSLLVKNMPTDDEEKYGRFNDILALVVRGANARLKSLESNVQAIQAKNQGLKELSQIASKDLESIEHIFKHYNESCQELIERFIFDIEESMLTFGFSDAQERTIRETLDGAKDDLQQIQAHSEDMSTTFNDFFIKLDKLID